MKFLINHICHVVLEFIRHAVLNVFEQSEHQNVYKVDQGSNPPAAVSKLGQFVELVME